jgi:PAS domain S-box-containing protein
VLDAASEVAIIATDHRGLITLFNQGAENLLGYPAHEVVGKCRLDELQSDPPAADPEARRRKPPARQARAGRTERSYRRKNGSPIQVSQIVTPASGRNGASGYLCVAHDVAESRRATGLQAAQNHVLEMIASGAPLPRVLDELVRGVEAQAGGLRCTVLLFDASTGTLRHGAAPSLPDTFNRAVDGLPIGLNRNAGTSASFLHDAVLLDDIRTDARWSALHAAALDAGLQAIWSTPILDAGGRLLGTFAVLNTDVGIDVAAAEKIVDVATHTAAIGIASALSAAAQEAGEKRMRLALPPPPTWAPTNTCHPPTACIAAATSPRLGPRHRRHGPALPRPGPPRRSGGHRRRPRRPHPDTPTTPSNTACAT